MKGLQYFSDEYLEHCKKMSTRDICEFLENFRLLQGAQESKSKLISIKIPEHLLKLFKQKCELSGMKYQTQIKQLMHDWLAEK